MNNYRRKRASVTERHLTSRNGSNHVNIRPHVFENGKFLEATTTGSHRLLICVSQVAPTPQDKVTDATGRWGPQGIGNHVIGDRNQMANYTNDLPI